MLHERQDTCISAGEEGLIISLVQVIGRQGSIQMHAEDDDYTHSRPLTAASA
jgi:hypothetical protein